jgi:ribosomal protein S6
MRYELFYLVAGSKESDLFKIKEGVKKIVTEEGGVFELKETTEKRRLAYKVNHETFGIYSALRFSLEDKDRFRVINKRMNLYPEVLRFIISRSDELPELLSREERIAASERTARRERQTEVKKVLPEPKKESKPAEKEDIDKKLEEILNI